MKQHLKIPLAARKELWDPCEMTARTIKDFVRHNSEADAALHPHNSPEPTRLAAPPMHRHAPPCPGMPPHALTFPPMP